LPGEISTLMAAIRRKPPSVGVSDGRSGLSVRIGLRILDYRLVAWSLPGEHVTFFQNIPTDSKKYRSGIKS